MTLNIKGKMKVKTLKANFKEEFGLTIRVYDGRRFADDNATLASIRKGDKKGGELSPKRNTKVGNLENKILELFGIKTQIAGSDDSYLCNNDLTLKTALEEDEKILTRKEKRVSKKSSSETLNEEIKTSSNSMKNIIEIVKSTYNGYDDLEEMITDLSEDSSVDWWAQIFCEENYGKNIELARKLFKIQETKCKDNIDFINLAKSISKEDALGDKVWAKELFEKVANNLNELSDYNSLIDSINYSLKDKEWANNLILQAKETLISSDDKFEFAENSDEIITLAKKISDENLINNKESAKEVFELVKESEDVTPLLDAGRAVKDIYKKESNYVKEYMNECLDRAIDYVHEGYYCDIYYFIKEDIEDEDRAQEFLDDYEDEMRNDYEEYESCEELFGNNENDIDFDDFDDKRNIVAFKTYELTFAKVEEMYDEEGNLPQEAYDLIRESLNEFIDAVKEKFGDNIEDTIYVDFDGKLIEYESNIDNNILKDIEEEMTLYMIFTKEIPSDTMDAMFLEMDEYGFGATFENDSEVITQSYDYGEYDTGYFSNDYDESYINNFESTYKLYKEAQKIIK